MAKNGSRKKKGGFKASLLALALLPMIIVTVLLCVVSFVKLKTELAESYDERLYAVNLMVYEQFKTSAAGVTSLEYDEAADEIYMNGEPVHDKLTELFDSYKQETGAKVTETTACVLSQEQINGFYLVFLFSFENANSASEFYNNNASAFAGTVTGEEKDYSYSYTVNNVSGDMYQMNCFYLADNQVMYITGWSTELDFVNSICSTMDVVSPFQQ